MLDPRDETHLPLGVMPVQLVQPFGQLISQLMFRIHVGRIVTPVSGLERHSHGPHFGKLLTPADEFSPNSAANAFAGFDELPVVDPHAVQHHCSCQS